MKQKAGERTPLTLFIVRRKWLLRRSSSDTAGVIEPSGGWKNSERLRCLNISNSPPQSQKQERGEGGAPVIFQEVVHSFLFGEAGCDEQLV
ncbi:MAG: hypothetical protein WB424_01465, partial [Terracidiphilus sp.]